jgi:PBP1b-binding outer membrane lipoprotein LpoB
MKKLKPIAIITLALFLNSCGLKEVVGPNAEGTTNSDSYQPVTKNST